MIKNVLIVGGGIGGHSAAIAFQKAGINTTIVEIQKEFNVYGVGIIQQANALRALDAIGIAHKAIHAGSPYGQVKLCIANGTQIGLAGAPSDGPYPSHNGISRKILHDILHAEAISCGTTFKMGTTVTVIDQDDNHVNATFTDGSTTQYDLLIAADGIHSKVRNMVFGELLPRYVGLSVWRYPFPRHKDLDTGYIYFGKKSKLGFIPMTADTMYMFLVSAEGENPAIKESDLIDKLKSYMQAFPVAIAQDALSQITNVALVNYRPLEALRLTSPWYQGRVVVLGDAAHATIPQLGSGAALAIEDAIVLVDELKKEISLQEALDHYMLRRFDRCMMVVNASETLGEWEKLEFEGKPLPDGANPGALMGKTIGALAAPI